METIIVVAPHQGVATFTVDIKAGTAGYEDVKALFIAVVYPFNIVLPLLVFVDFIEDEQSGGRIKT